jgi:hypothetical protein
MYMPIYIITIKDSYEGVERVFGRR